MINPDKNDERVIQFSRDSVPVKAGDIVRVTTPGGGGFGDPLERDAEAVRLDVQRGLVTQKSAAVDYGVVVLAKRPGRTTIIEIDHSATLKLRNDMSAKRPPLLLIERGLYAKKMRDSGRIDFKDLPLAS